MKNWYDNDYEKDSQIHGCMLKENEHYLVTLNGLLHGLHMGHLKKNQSSMFGDQLNVLLDREFHDGLEKAFRHMYMTQRQNRKIETT